MKRVGNSQSIRSDKKRDVKPTIQLDLKDALYRLSHLTFMPVKDVCQQMAIMVLYDRKTIEHLSKYFKRDLLTDRTVYIGNMENPSIAKRLVGRGERVTIRFTQGEYEALAMLSFALDCTTSRAVSLLLSISMRNVRFINRFIKQYLREQLSDSQMRELQAILRYTNRTGESHHSWASLLAYVAEEVGGPVARIKEAVNEFIDMKWRD